MAVLKPEEIERYKQFSFSDSNEKLPPRITSMTPRKRSAYQKAEALAKEKGYETLAYCVASMYQIDRKHLTEIRREMGLTKDDFNYLMHSCDIPKRGAKKNRGSRIENDGSQSVETCIRKIESHVEQILKLKEQESEHVSFAEDVCNLTPSQQRRIIKLYHIYEARTKATGFIIRKISEETGIQREDVSGFLEVVGI